MTVSYAEWIAAKRAQALASGGKRWTRTMLAAAKREATARRHGVHMSHRKPGEIVNPTTGEVVTGCITIGKLASSLGTTTARLTDLMEQRGLVHRVLTWKHVPMICHPGYRKPDYYLTPEATPAAVFAGQVVQIKGQWGLDRKGAHRSMILITPLGQERIRNAFLPPTGEPKATQVRRESIERLHRQGRTPAEIVRTTGIARRTVFRHLDVLRKAA